MKWLPLLIIVFLSQVAVAMASAEDSAQKARFKQYAGGIDEDELRVQDPLPTPVRKIQPKTIQEQVYKTLFEDKEDKKEKEDSSAKN